MGHVRHPKTYITLTPTAVKINWTNMATKTTSHSTLVGTRLDGTQPIYEQLMWEIKLYLHEAVMPRAWGITATCTGHNRHQLWPNSQISIKLNWEAECDYSTVAMFFFIPGESLLLSIPLKGDAYCFCIERLLPPQCSAAVYASVMFWPFESKI